MRPQSGVTGRPDFLWDGDGMDLPPFKRALGLNLRPGAVAEKLLHRPRYQIAILDTFSRD